MQKIVTLFFLVQFSWPCFIHAASQRAGMVNGPFGTNERNTEGFVDEEHPVSNPGSQFLSFTG